jgi:hypothetical protein
MSMTISQLTAEIDRKVASSTDSEILELYRIIQVERVRRGLDTGEGVESPYPKWMTPSMINVVSIIAQTCYNRGIILERDSLGGLLSYKDILQDYLAVVHSMHETNRTLREGGGTYSYSDFLRAVTVVQVGRTLSYHSKYSKPFPTVYKTYVSNMNTIGPYLSRKYPKYIENGLIAIVLFNDLAF